MIKILNSKLRIPNTSETIRREKLFPLQAEILSKRLTTVIAGAGYGKTTLIAQAIKNLNLKTVWYRLDKTDRDFITFIRYLIEGIQKYFYDFGSETLQAMEATQNPNLDQRDILTILIYEIEQIVKKDLFIVLDDYHNIQASREINKTIEFFLDCLPSSIHLIIISRMELTLHLSRIRSSRRSLEIMTEDLVFTFPEIKQLYIELFDTIIPDPSLKILQQKIDGWVSGLILFYHSIRIKKPYEIDKSISELKGSHEIIADYLEENVYESLSSEIQNFLIKTSILSNLNVAFCNQYLRINNSGAILKELEKCHLFTFAFDEEKEWFYYHHLFQEFLKKKLEIESDATVIKRLHIKAAQLYIDAGEKGEALSHCISAEKFDQACNLLKQTGLQLLEKGQLQLVNSYLEKIPERYLNKESWFQYFRSRLIEISGNYQDAAKGYKNALDRFLFQKSEKEINECLLALGRTYFLMGDFQKAETHLNELINRKNLIPDIHIWALGYLIVIFSQQGKTKLADQYIHTANLLLSEVEIPQKQGLAILYLFQSERCLQSGKYTNAIAFGENAKKIFKDTHHFHPMISSFLNISYACFQLGLYKKGLKNAEQGLKITKEKSFQTNPSYANLLLCSTNNCIGLGKISQANHDVREGLKCFQDKDDRFGQARAYSLLHLINSISGDISAAEKYARTGLEMMKGLSVPFLSVVLKMQLANMLLIKGQPDEALANIQDAEKICADSKSFDHNIALMYALYYDRTNQKALALKKMLECLVITQRDRYGHWLLFGKKKDRFIHLLVELYAQGKMKDYIQKIIKMTGPYGEKQLTAFVKNSAKPVHRAASDLLNQIPKTPPPDLKIRFFGNFIVFIGDKKITPRHWKSKKAEMMFKYLLFKRTQGYLKKEVFMELLWPDDDPEKTAKRFHVALASIRKVLEPDILKGTPSRYILRNGNAYSLYIGKTGWIDIEQFSEELHMAKKEKRPEIAIQHYKTAESIYEGDFLAEDRYVDWCTEEREKFKDDYLFILRKIISYFEHQKNYSTCIDYAVKYLKKDKCAENIYRKLMKYYSFFGNNTMVINTFEKCKESLIVGLDCPISKETEILYQKLISK